MPSRHAELADEDGTNAQFSGKDLLNPADQASEQGPMTQAKSLEQQKAEYLRSGEVPTGEIMRFQLAPGTTAYNPSHVIRQTLGGQTEECIAARVEQVGEELASTVKLYRKTTDTEGAIWVELTGDGAQVFTSPVSTETNDTEAPTFIKAGDRGATADVPFGPKSYQDPAIATGTIGDAELVIVAVVQAQELHRVDSAPEERRSEYHQEFWAGPSLDRLEKLADGPKERKGTRIVHLGAGKWGVFNRPQSPQGQQYGPGRVTYSEFEADTPEAFKAGLETAITDLDTVIPGLCNEDQWVGPNQAWPLKDGNIGVIGHIARMVDRATGIREYCASSFIYDPANNQATDVRIIATKDSFKNVRPRPDRQDLNEVIYPGGADVQHNGKLRLYCGVSDSSAAIVDINDPFEGRRV